MRVSINHLRRLIPTKRLFAGNRRALLGGSGNLPVPVYVFGGSTGVAAPTAAYGVIRLSEDYSGPLFQVIRASDSATQDISATRSGYLNYTTLTSFLAGTTGKIKQYYDQTGNGHTASQAVDATRPQIDLDMAWVGRGATVFNGHSITIPNSIVVSRQASHVFMVLENLRYNENNSFIQLGTGAPATVSAHLFSPPVAGGINTAVRLLTSTGNIMTYKTQMRPCIFEAKLGTTAEGGTLAAQNAESIASGQSSAGNMTGGSIGAYSQDATYLGYYNFGCCLIYSAVQSAGAVSALKTTLADAFDIVEAPSPVFLVEGDSISVGSDSPHSFGWAHQTYRQLSQPVNFFSTASGGARASSQIGQYAAQAGLIFDQYPGALRIGTLSLGTNDLTTDGRTAAQIYGDLQTLGGLMQADGASVIVSTLTPNSSWDAAKQAIWNDLNGQIRAGYLTFADAICDFAANPIYGPWAAASNNDYYPDGLHPSRYVHGLMAADMKPVVESLL